MRRPPMGAGQVAHLFASRRAGGCVIVHASDWSAEEDAPGGYGTAQGIVPAEIVNRYPRIIQYGAEWRIVHSQSGRTRWGGKLLEPSPRADGRVQLAGRGWGDRIGKSVDRLMYQKWGADFWKPQESEGWAESNNLWSRNAGGALRFRTVKGQDYTVGDELGFVFHIPEVAIDELRFVYGRNATMTSFDIRILTAGGPSPAARTLVHTVDLATQADDSLIEIDIGVPQTYVLATFYCTTTHTATTWRSFSLSDVRVNGRGVTGDQWAASAMVKDLFTRAGIKTLGTGVRDNSVSPMPYDQEGGTVADALAYVCAITDWRTFVGGGHFPEGTFLPWDTEEWRVDDPHVVADLVPLLRFDSVRVPFRTQKGLTEGVEVQADRKLDEPEAFTGFDLSQPYPNDRVARQVGKVMANYLYEPRHGGSVRVVTVKDREGQERSALEVLHAGSTLWLPALGYRGRVRACTAGPRGVAVQFDERLASIDRLQTKNRRDATIAGV